MKKNFKAGMNGQELGFRILCSKIINQADVDYASPKTTAAERMEIKDFYNSDYFKFLYNNRCGKDKKYSRNRKAYVLSSGKEKAGGRDVSR